MQSSSHRCPACLSPDETFCFTKNDHAVFRCARCGLGRAIAPAFEPERYYTEAYFEGGHSDGYANYGRSESILRREFTEILHAIGAAGVRSGRLLEIGCAYGFFLQEAKGAFDVHGIEISEAAVAECRKAGLAFVEAGSATPESIARVGRTDAVVLLDVIEHLVEPISTLRAAVGGLRSGGVILMTTGDFGSFVARAFGPRWRLMTPPQHLWFFTATSFHFIAKCLGLQVVEIVHPWKTVPMSLAWYQLQRMLGRRDPSALDWLANYGVPVNLFDAVRVILRKPA